MGFIQDISPILKKRELSLVESFKESKDVYTFIFEKGEDLNWKPGQHGAFTIIHKKITKPTRPFTVASTPSEENIKISMTIGNNPSEFKQAMLELKPGMKVSMRGPIGPLYINDDSPSLLIAGGIGITPFRAMLKAAQENSLRNDLTLLYIDSKGCFIYKDELDEMAANKSSIKVTYFKSREDLYKEIDKFTAQYENNGKYFIAGSKTMVNSVSTYLKDLNIIKKNIKKDVFLGY